MYKTISFLLLLLLFSTHVVFTQDNSKKREPNTIDPFVISSVIYTHKKNETDTENKGRAKVERLKAGFANMEQLGFADLDALVKYLTKVDQDIEAERLFAAHSVTVKSTKKVGNQTLVEVEFLVEDTIPYALIPYIDYSSSVGFTVAGANIFSNVDGQLFNLIIKGEMTFPSEENRISWNTPSFNAAINFADVQIRDDLKFNNEITFGHFINYISNKSSPDLGYRGLEFVNEAALKWEFRDDIFLNTKLNVFATANTEIIYDHDPTIDYGYPYKFYVNPALEIEYNKAPWVGKARKGYAVKTEIGYMLYETLRNPNNLHNSLVLENKIGYFGQPTTWFFPEVSSTVYYKSGLPEYDLGRFVSGIPDGNLSGNGGLFINSAYMFKFYRKKRVIEMQMGPVVGYAATFDQTRNFERDDQGFTVGLRGLLYFDQLPSIPFYITLAVDLRDGISRSNFGSRVELDLTTKHYFEDGSKRK